LNPASRRPSATRSVLLLTSTLGQTRRGLATLLDGISLELHPGDRLGVIGANGAGKSTFLRLLAGIYAPTTEVINVNGTVCGLFDVTLGMNQEATGLENIYIRGLQIGLTLPMVREKISDVLAFSELGDAVEKPLNTYSTGMRLRLAVGLSARWLYRTFCC
jgi:lipopolysaccharide transport system ATP-binding protein